MSTILNQYNWHAMLIKIEELNILLENTKNDLRKIGDTRKEIAFLEDKKKKAEKLKEAEEFRRRNNPTIEERKEDLQKAKDNAREVTESLRYLRPNKR